MQKIKETNGDRENYLFQEFVYLIEMKCFLSGKDMIKRYKLLIRENILSKFDIIPKTTLSRKDYEKIIMKRRLCLERLMEVSKEIPDFFSIVLRNDFKFQTLKKKKCKLKKNDQDQENDQLQYIEKFLKIEQQLKNITGKKKLSEGTLKELIELYYTQFFEKLNKSQLTDNQTNVESNKIDYVLVDEIELFLPETEVQVKYRKLLNSSEIDSIPLEKLTPEDLERIIESRKRLIEEGRKIFDLPLSWLDISNLKKLETQKQKIQELVQKKLLEIKFLNQKIDEINIRMEKAQNFIQIAKNLTKKEIKGRYFKKLLNFCKYFMDNQ